jgi:hypothetical protein
MALAIPAILRQFKVDVAKGAIARNDSQSLRLPWARLARTGAGPRDDHSGLSSSRSCTSTQHARPWRGWPAYRSPPRPAVSRVSVGR